jgi:hypothetical protein
LQVHRLLSPIQIQCNAALLVWRWEVLDHAVQEELNPLILVGGSKEDGREFEREASPADRTAQLLWRDILTLR